MSRIKVLIADDVQGLREMLKVQLRSFNCEICREVSDGRKVIDGINNSSPDIVFLDIDMPGRNGLEVLREISENQIHDKVWVVSGDDRTFTIKKSLEYGACGFISKPFTIEQVRGAISRYEELINIESETGMSHNSELTRVIIADDEVLMLQLLEKVLTGFHCDVQMRASSGREVIEKLKSGDEPEMIFLDIEMPDGNGFEALKYIKDNKVPTFVVMVSAHGTIENVKSCMESGADGFIVKPYSEKKIEQLVKKYRKTLNRK